MLRGLTIALVVLGLAAPAQGAVSREFVGTHHFRDPSRDDFERMAEATAIYRANLYWPAVEQFEPGMRDWSRYDAVIGGAARSGIRVMATVYGSTDWAAASPEHPPDAAHRDDFGSFLEAAVRRYGRGGEFWAAHPELPALPVRAWELWNEPNNPTFWLARPTAAQYRRLLVVAARAVRRADPSAQVVLGGLFPTAYSSAGIAMPAYLAALYGSGADRYFDAVAVHPYGRDPEAAFEVVERARAIMDTRGDSEKPIWITEIGWATSGSESTVTVSERAQAEYLRETVTTAAARRRQLGIAGLFWFSYRDQEDDGWPARTGLLRADGSEKPSWRALLALTEEGWAETVVAAIRGLTTRIAAAARR